METLAIVGASLAGLSAARAARAKGFAGRLVIVGDEAERPYDRPPLSKDFLLGRMTAGDLALEAGNEDLQAEWLLGHRALGLDGEAKAIMLEDGTIIAADGIVIATGASARRLPSLEGFTNVHTLRTLDDSRQLAAELLPGRRLVIIGAGFIGAEVASTASSLGLEVTLVNAEPVPFSAALGAEMGEVVAGLQVSRGVALLRDTTIDSVESAGGRVTGLNLTNGQRLAADLVLVGIGAVPNTAWLSFSGLDVKNGVLCDAAGRTNLPGIVAAGDCAAWFDERAETHRRVEHWTSATEQAEIAVEALLGAAPSAAKPKPHYFWSDQHGVKLQFAGNAGEADRVEIEAGSAQAHDLLAVYYRASEPVAVLGMNQPRLFVKWRRALAQAAASAPTSSVPA
ncbi:pyridine nucleotide-disulfide oxidoreductase [Zafaria cholistanensis]|uniref:Pyridine nucleotide-disulfide oxidoreductase n=1 Tax=Zafaria cholistanensis TaxID=1682741 RepID=A0A5A7NRA5_9MICC|nr:FAD-dependent oxidoreductase [Zafaria cholistanensis]GER23340.1 pyridine nucleotide-disulfide oxidoreductase [Zafaria cholistanensis]